VNTPTTVPVAGSTSAVASRTSTPVIRLISCRSESDAVANNWRWNSCTWAAPAGLLANSFSACDKAPCSVITSVSPLRTTVTEWGACPVRCCSKAAAAWATCSAMFD
jgi:hypothetical protein